MYFECLRHSSTDFFPKNRPELVEEFKNLPKLKDIFLESFKRCKFNSMTLKSYYSPLATKDTFENNFDEIYFKIGGRTKQYMKFYGNALLMVEEFKKNWNSIIPMKNPEPLISKPKKRKSDSLSEDDRESDDVYEKNIGSRLGYRRLYDSVSDNESNPRGRIERRQRSAYEGVGSRRGYRKFEDGFYEEDSDYQMSDRSEDLNCKRGYRRLEEDDSSRYTNDLQALEKLQQQFGFRKRNETVQKSVPDDSDALQSSDESFDEDIADNRIDDIDLHESEKIQRKKENMKVKFNDDPIVHEIPVLNPGDKEIYEGNRQDCFSNFSISNLIRDPMDFVIQCPGVEEDNKVLNIENSENALAALPYAFNLIPAPSACSSSEWMSQSDESKPRIIEAFKAVLLKFHYSEPIPRRRNLFIFDTLLKPLKTHTIMKYSEGIDLSYPTPFSTFFQALQEIRRVRKNAYIIPKIYIAYGMDLVIRSMDRECCLTEVESFFNKLLKTLEEDFGEKSPPRFKNAESDEPVSPQFPIIYIVTIPYCKSKVPGVIDFNDRFKKVNNFLRNFAKEKNGLKGRVMEIIDWQKIIEKEEKEILEVSKEMVDMRAYKLHEVIFKDQQEFLISK